MTGDWFVGVDLGGTTIKLAFINLYGEIQHKWEILRINLGRQLQSTLPSQLTIN